MKEEAPHRRRELVPLSAFDCRRDDACHRSTSCASKGPHAVEAAPEPSRPEPLTSEPPRTAAVSPMPPPASDRERERDEWMVRLREEIKRGEKRKKKRKEKEKRREKEKKGNKKGIILFIFRNYDSQILFCLLLLHNENRI
jgi:hypothetical protein